MHMVMAFAGLGTLEDSGIVHKQLIQCGCESDVSVGSSFIGMYAKCGSMENAWRVFKKISSQDIVTWTAMVLGHVKCSQGQEAMELF
jgi:pentatricopeptide repeat protein